MALADWIYVAYTVLLFAGHVSFGITSSLYGPTLMDLAYLQQQNGKDGNVGNDEVNLGETTLFFSFFCGGCITGALWTGLYKYKISKKYLNRQLLTSIFLMVASIVHSLIPQTRSYYVLFLAAYGSGFGAGTWNAVVTTWLMEMWTGKVLASILQAVQAVYGVGGILAPLLARSFLHQGVHEKRKIDEVSALRRSLTIPYAISGSLQFLVGASVFALYFLAKYHPRDKKPVQNNENDNTETENKSTNQIQEKKILDIETNHRKRILFHVLMVGSFFFYHGAEIGFSSFQNAYFIKLNIDAKRAADLSSIGAAAYTAGRGLNIIIIRFLSAGTILYGHYILAAIGFGSLYFIRNMNGALQWWMLILDCSLIGYAQSAIFSACFAFIDIYTKVDDRHNSIYFTAIGLPMLFVPIAVNRYIDQIPDIVIHISFGAILASLTLYASIRFMIKNLK